MNAKFKSNMLPVVIISFISVYFYAGLQTDHNNVLQPYMSEVFGWDALKITNPMTYGGYFAIILTVIVGTILIKYGVRKVMGIGLLAMGVSCIGLGIAIGNGAYALYAVCLFLVRSLTVPLFMGSMMFCTNWFVSTRGRIMGIVTIGLPLETATLITLLTKATTSSIGLKGAYIIIGVAVIIVGIATFLVTKDTPEEIGCHPDGAEEAPVVPEEGMVTAKEVFTNKNAWLLMIGMGLCQFMIICNMAFFVTDCMMAGVEQSVYLTALSVGSLLGIPLSYILGAIDDKIGTAKACMILCVFFFLTAIGLLLVKGDSMLMICFAALGCAGITGGTPNLLPSLTSYIFGRKNYQAANRWTFMIISIFGSVAVLFMATILDSTGSLKTGYMVEIGLTVIALICFAIIGRTPDHDRG